MKLKFNYLLIPTLVAATSLAGSWFTDQGMDWYQTLEKPAITPPGWFIGLVWTIIYILTAWFALKFWNQAEREKIFWWVAGLLGLNAFLNAGWSYLFFYKGMIWAAFFEMIILGASVYLIIFFAQKQLKKAAYLLYPYLIWVGFATFLTWQILVLNS